MDLQNWKLIFGLAASVIGGVWTVFVYFDKKRSAAPANPPPDAPRVNGSWLPLAGVFLVFVGVILVGWSLLLGPQTMNVTAKCGTAVGGGGITNSNISNDC